MPFGTDYQSVDPTVSNLDRIVLTHLAIAHTFHSSQHVIVTSLCNGQRTT